MFIGHYSVSYVLKRKDYGIPLWHLFLAAQLMDIVWSIFIFLGIEKADTKTGLPGSHIHLDYMPYSHSLIGSLVLSVLMVIFYRFLPSNRNKEFLTSKSLLMGIAVFSHWILDLIVHSKDLPIIGNSFKVGFGLYSSALWSFTLEAILLGAAILIYYQTTKQKKKYQTLTFYLFLLLLNASTVWGPVAPNEKFAAGFLLVCYLLFAYISSRFEKAAKPGKDAKNDLRNFGH
ncbi:hypothetical protein PH210_04695 [Paenibacillus sp. BSR1-1]|uniref:hypothetical protein n=1 Tax=Paenibacillus sp. BSR1-1 TaxID=3020845 RepID=UPI0025AEDE27|nr:hypothetical protein [Paenibacillus sp. BSR1-1]MDN3015507.1 hypothetical protein [Paenibacillus sp. BSR1-1]